MKDLKKISKPQIESEQIYKWIIQLRALEQHLDDEKIFTKQEFSVMTTRQLINCLFSLMRFSSGLEELIDHKEKLEDLLIKNI